MKLGRWIFISGLIVCISLTFWQKDNLKIVWNEYWKLQRSYDTKIFKPRIPAIDKKIEKLDPEAATIINYKLNSLDRDDKEQLEILSQNILKYPDNQFFLYELATSTHHNIENGLSSQILLKLSNRLIELDHQNSNYYYLKALALLNERQGNDFTEVADTIKKIEKCQYSKAPYSLYKTRALALAKKQGLHYRLMEDLYYENNYNFFINDIRDTLIQYQNLLITEKDFDKADEISNILKITSKNEPLTRLMHMYQGGFGNWEMPQQVELQRKNLTQAEADRKRMELCSYLSLDTVVASEHKSYELYKKASQYATAVFPFLFLSRLSLIYIILIAILLLSIFIHKENPIASKTSKAAVTRFSIYSLVFLISSQFLLIAELFSDDLSHDCCHYTYSDIFLFPPILKELNFRVFKDLFDAPFYVYLPIIAFIIVIILGIIKLFKPIIDNIFTRFLCGILIAIPLGLITGILQGHKRLRYIIALIFILFAFKYSFRSISLKNILQGFTGRRDDKIIKLRMDLFKLSVISFFIYWFGVLLLTGATYKSMKTKEIDVSEKTYSYSGDYKKGYEEILKKIYDVNLYEQGVPYYISLVQSEDLPQVLQKLKEKRFAPPWGVGVRNNSDANDKRHEYLYDRLISHSLYYAGRDQMPVIVSYLNNPEDTTTLIARAMLGDKQVKNDLLNVLEETKKTGDKINELENIQHIRIPREHELIVALSVISEPNETVALVKEYFQANPAEKIDMYFNFKGANMLPRIYARQIINLYLDKAEKEIGSLEDIRKYSLLYPLRDLAGLYWDSETAKKILNLILTVHTEDRHLETFGIEYYFTSDFSDLLVKGLQNDKDNLRAWCVWQLGKIGYKWNEDELKKISEDKSWKVRANLALINKSLIKDNEASAYVKLIKSL